MYKNEENGLASEAAPSPEIAPDIAKYRAALADVAMTDEQKDEFLLTLWEILSNVSEKARPFSLGSSTALGHRCRCWASHWRCARGSE